MQQKQSNPFYRSKEWRHVRAEALRRDHYMCVDCMRRFLQGGVKPRRATLVHHIKTLEACPELALELSNLQSSCDICHNKSHPEKGAKKAGTKDPLLQRNVRIIKM